MGYANKSAVVAPLNGRRHEVKPRKGARGRKPIDVAELEKALRSTRSAFEDELYPEGRPSYLEFNRKKGKWRIRPAKKWSEGWFNLWCRARNVKKTEGARQVEEWLAGKEPENETSKSTKPKSQSAAIKRSPKTVNLAHIKTAFAEFACGLGLVEPKGGFIADGKLHRCNVAASPKDKKDAASYQLYTEGVPGGWAQNWTNGLGAQNWSLRSEDKLTAAERAEFRQRREKERREHELEETKRRKEAAIRALEILGSSAEATSHPYLSKKGLQSGFGLRIRGDRLIMALHDGEGVLHSLQYIDGDGGKRFLPGGRKNGLFYAIGRIESQGEALIGEGFATMASVHEATKKPCIVALDCGNLRPVSEVLSKKYPQTAFIICADDDFRTDGNPGKTAAAEAAEAIGAKIAYPVFSGERQEKWTDFNDLHAAEGLDAVRRCIEAAENPKAPAKSWLPERGFRLKDNGRVEFDTGDEEPNWRWLCSPVEITANTSNEDGVEHGSLIRVYDQQNSRWHEWAMPKRLLAGDGNAYRAELFAMGLKMPLTAKARNAFGQLLMTANPARNIRCVERTGWHGNVFVLPNGVIGRDHDRDVVFQSWRPVHAKFRASGTLHDWQDNVAVHAIGNSRLILGISAAFAAPCLKLARQDGAGIHFWGDSSGGKTTTLRVSGSVWGGGSVSGFVDNWSNTMNGLEGRALAHSDALLCLQELGQADPDAAADAAYKIANGQGKGRMNRDAVLRDTPEWRVLFLSDGEITLDDKIRESRNGKRRMAGQMVRVIDIEADAGKGFGAFDRLPEGMNGREFSDLLRENSGRYFGTAAPAFLEELTSDVEDVSKYLQNYIDVFVRKFASNAGAQAERVAKRFGLIAAAGELAINFGILPWPKGDASAAAKRCFVEWLTKHGATGPFEIEQGIDQIRCIIERAASSRFETLGKEDAKPVYDRLGYVRNTDAGQTFYVLPQGWKEMCRGYNPERLSAELVKRGILKPDSGGKTSRPEWLPGTSTGKKRRVYVLDASALFEDEADVSDAHETGNDLVNGVPGVPSVLHGAMH